MGKLVLHLPDGSTREFPLERERMVIGRRAENDICLPFPAVSAEHAAVITILDDSFLEDLGSTNGTRVNGKKVSKHFLRDNDAIDVGRLTLVYQSSHFPLPSQASLSDPMATIAVTANGGATIGDDESTVVPPARRRASAEAAMNADATAAPADPGSSALEPDTRPNQATRMATDVVARSDAPADQPTLEVLDGPSAGLVVQIGQEDFVLGRVGVQIAALRGTPEGFRLLPLEGDPPPRVNGAALPGEGIVLAPGDEIEVAGTRLLFRPSP